MNHAHGQYSALGYSGTNSGGQLVVENSEFDHNKDGFDTNSQNNDDSPSPQDGACPNGGTSPITHTHSCWVFTHNYVHDNNNPNVPGTGAAAAGPVGTGMSISGARDNTIVGNRFENNGAWGIILVPYPDTETPPAGQDCQGGVKSGPPSNVCLYDDWGNAILNNTFKHNGFFGNDTNSDFGEITTTGPNPTNCFSGNTETGGGDVTSSPSGLQQSKPTCGGDAAPDPNPQMTNQVACDSQFFGSLAADRLEPLHPGFELPAADEGRDAAAAQAPQVDAAPVQGRSRQRLVPGQAPREVAKQLAERARAARKDYCAGTRRIRRCPWSRPQTLSLLSAVLDGRLLQRASSARREQATWQHTRSQRSQGNAHMPSGWQLHGWRPRCSSRRAWAMRTPWRYRPRRSNRATSDFRPRRSTCRAATWR